MRVAVNLVANNTRHLAGALRSAARQEIERTVYDIEARAKVLCPVDTGNLRNSITGVMNSDTSGAVYTVVEYSIYVEYGTYRMSAQPYMTPAAEQARPRFLAALQNLERHV